METNLRDFVDVLTDIRGGSCHHELSLALKQATEAAIDTGKKAAVTVTLNIKPQGNVQVEIADVIKKTIPEQSKPTTFMFVDGDSNLTRDDRRQMTLQDVIPKKGEMVELATPEKQLREVGK